MSGLYVNDAGTWRRIRAVWVNDAGTWRQLKAVWVNDGGTWRRVFSPVGIPDQTVSQSDVSPADVSVGIGVQNAGLYYKLFGGATASNTLTLGEWVNPTSDASLYEVRCTVVSGSLNGSSSATGTWLAFGSSFAWTITRTTNVIGTTSAVLTIEFRRASDGSVVSSSTITLEATVTA